ncbi:ParB N-terminal domain-containing protein [Brevundimonas sp.]|uniref:ParB N-terminal domain-containing protein n=1 Tax=Brevundimonas sp. TaxID=1871086 RepID=UPI0028ABCE45|nr:ParB N-terminal domain-containing protein [Brevundimonas sp.]
MIQIDRITTFDRVRQADRKQVEALAESIREVGLLNPIAVAPDGEGYALIAGMHRLEAARLLGWTEIPATVLALDQHRRIIAECDENLCAPSLTPAERAEFTRRRKAAYEALHPETRADAPKGNQYASRQVGDKQPAPRFTADTAAATGQSERAVQRDAERGEKVSDEALALIKGTRLDTGRYLDSIKNLSAEDQVAKVEADLAPPSETVEKRGTTPPAEPAEPIDPAEAKARREIAQMTDEAKADEIIALRAEVVDLRKAVKEHKANTAKLKAQLKGHQGDKDDTIRSQAKELKHASSEMFRAKEEAARVLRHNHVLKKENEKLKAEIENQVFQL